MAGRACRVGTKTSMQHLTDLRCARSLQTRRQSAAVPQPAPPALTGPAALNAIGDAILRDHILAIVQQPPGNEPRTRAPLLAPYITNEMLRRTNNVLADLNGERMSGWGLQASFGRVVAALTGAPPPSTMEDATHWGNAMQRAVSHFTNRLRTKHARANSSRVKTYWKKVDEEKLYICQYRGTPDRPSDAVLAAGLQSQPQPVPPSTSTKQVPVQSAPKRGAVHLVQIGSDQIVMSLQQEAALRAEASDRDASQHKADTMASHANENASKVRKLAEKMDVETARADAAEENVAEAAKRAKQQAKEVAKASTRLTARILELQRQVERSQKALEQTEHEHYEGLKEIARQESELEHRMQVEDMKLQRAAAHTEKRDWKRRAETAEDVARKRMERTKAAEEQVERLKNDIEELHEEMETLQRTEMKLEDRSADGRFRSYPWQVRVAAMAQLSRGTPPSAVGQNMVDAAYLCSSDGASFREPSRDLMQKLRQENTIIGETLSAYIVADCERVLSFGIDETTKLQACRPALVFWAHTCSWHNACACMFCALFCLEVAGSTAQVGACPGGAKVPKGHKGDQRGDPRQP